MPAFESQRVKDATDMEVAQQQILGDIDDRGILSLGASASGSVAGEVPAGQGDLAHAAAGN